MPCVFVHEDPATNTSAVVDKRVRPYDTGLYSVVEIEMKLTGLEVLWTFGYVDAGIGYV